MTVSTTKTSKVHEPNGSATVFGFDFPVLDAAYLVVTHTVGSNITTLLLDRDYTVQGVGEDAGGSITTTGLLTGGTLTIRRQTPILQETLLRNQSKFHAEVHEAVLDRLTMIQQELLTVGGEAIQGPPGPPGANGKDGAQGKDGSPGTPGTAALRTLDLALSSTHGSVDLGRVFQIERITFSAPGRFRLYLCDEARLADQSRAEGVPDVLGWPGSGLLLEALPKTGELGGYPGPVAQGAPLDSLCYWSWDGPTPATASIEFCRSVAGSDLIPRDGTNVYCEARDPLPSDGVSGESWINNLTWDYFKKESGTWTLKGNIKGADGSGADVYSTTETATGKTWIDGKTIYRKVVNIGNLPDKTEKLVAHGITNIGYFVSITGIAKSTAGHTIPLSFPWPDGISDIPVWADATNVHVKCGVNNSAYTGYAILEYTKV